MRNARLAVPLLFLVASVSLPVVAFGSVKDYQVCLQAYVNVTGYLQFAQPSGMGAERTAFDIDFQSFIQMGIDRYGEARLRQMIPEPDESFIKAMVPLHSTDGAERTAARLLRMVAPCGGPAGELRSYYPS